jgi:hypothetical protein
MEHPCEGQRIDDVGNAVTARDDRRIFVDQTVVHSATFVVPSVLTLEQLPVETREDVIDSFGEW